jgi:hypothetical protein
VGLFAVNGTKAYIGGALAADTGDMSAADFEGVAWVEIAGLVSLGTLGGEASMGSGYEIDFADPYSPARLRKWKDGVDPGTFELVAAASDDDSQVALIEAQRLDASYAFRIDLPNGARRLFVAYVVSATDVFDQANAVIRFGTSLAIDSNIVRIAAPGA